jgi:C-5 cytosine-specific DNA methylase
MTNGAPSPASTWPRAAPELAPLELSPAPERSPVCLRMLDLFSGSGGASRAALVRGWRVLRVDNALGTAHDVRADLATWLPQPSERFDLVWASPPCTELSSASTKRDVTAGLVLVQAALRIIRVVQPRWWVLENVHGATRAIGDLIGPPVATYGSFYLWGVFPPFEADVPRNKTKLSGRRRAERRAAIPWAISLGLVRACEELARELDAP